MAQEDLGVPRPKKPLLPRWVKFLLILVGTFFFLAAGAWVLLDIITRQDLEAILADLEAEGRPMSAKALHEGGLPDSENAAVVYTQAFAKLSLTFKEEYLLDHMRQGDVADAWPELSRTERAQVVAVLSNNAPFFQLLHRAALMDRCQFDVRFPPLYDCWHAYEEELEASRELLYAQVIVCLAQGEVREAFAVWQDWAALLRHEAAQETVNWHRERLFRLYCMLKGLEAVVRTNRLTETELLHVRRALEGQEARGALVEALKSDALAIERLLALTAGKPAPQVSLADVPFPRAERSLSWLYASPLGRPWRRHDQAAYLTLLVENVRLIQSPFHAVREQVEEWQSRRRGLSWKTPASRQLPYRLFDASDVAWHDAQLASARVAVALELYRLAKGNYPSKLQELCPEFMTELPADPYDGKPIRYLNDGQRVVVYSVGENLRDDGGSDEVEETEPGFCRSEDLLFTVSRRPAPVEEAGDE